MDIPKGCIALFIHQPKCSVQSGNGIVHALSPHYRFKIFTRHDVEADFFDDVDIVCVPGGIGDSDSYGFLMKELESKIQKFVLGGGKYLGICMGAYWADEYYFDLLCDVRAEQYITRPGTDTRRPHAKNQKVTWQGQEEKMFFYDGCAFTGLGLSTSDIWAQYPNGDPMAIIQGRIGLIGCHPESQYHWYQKPREYIQHHWHQGRHHELLLGFVDQLMSQ